MNRKQCGKVWVAGYSNTSGKVVVRNALDEESFSWREKVVKDGNVGLKIKTNNIRLSVQRLWAEKNWSKLKSFVTWKAQCLE